jgi:hypothetical protein
MNVKSSLRSLDYTRIAGSKLFWSISLPISIWFLITLQNIQLYFSQTDAFLYLGYAIDYEGLQQRWGHTYPASRISTILPIAFREHFGISTQLWRIGLIVIIALAIFSSVVQRTSPLKAFLVSIVIVNNTWLYDHLSDDMNFGYAIVYAMVSLALYYAASQEVENRNRVILNLISGFFVALTLNSHFIYLFVFAPIFFGIAICKISEYRQTIRDTKYILIGLIVGYLLILVVSINLSGGTGVMNHLSLAKQFLVNSGESGRIWTKPILYFFPFAVIIIFIPLLAISKFLNERTNLVKGQFALSFGIFLMGCFSVAYHFLSGGPILSITRYTSIYLTPILFLAALLLIDAPKKHLLSLLALQMSIVLLVQIIPGWETSNRVTSALRILILLPLFIVLMFWKAKFVRKSHGIVAAFVISFLPLTQVWGNFAISSQPVASPNGEYREFLSTMSSGTWIDQQNFASEIAKTIKSEIPPNFYGWTMYPNSPAWLGGIDATQLWGYSCYKCMSIQGLPIERSYPPFTNDDIVEIKKRDYVVIFDNSRSRLELMTEALLEAERSFIEKPLRQIIGKDHVLYFQFIFTGLER